ncbi:MAG: AraC family transcriptional regulator [Caulobacter sp.]|nr:AraC family transcriptional regulator [Caulobacter sp.]
MRSLAMEGKALDTLETLVRGIAVGAMLCTALAMLTGRPMVPARWCGALFSLAAAGFALHSGGAETRAVWPIILPIWLLSMGGTAYFWMFGMALFEDRPFRLTRWIPAVVMTLVGLTGAWTARPLSEGIWVFHNLLEVALVGHVLSLVWRHREGDLIEARRALRTPVIVLISIYAIALSGFEIAFELGMRAPWLSLLQAASLAVISLLAAMAFLTARPGLFAIASDERVLEPRVEDIDPQDRPLLTRLQSVMTEDQIWRQEGLTIGRLAASVQAPEHRLRRLINGGLGYRNFADFLNGQRIEAARTTLSDPAQARLPVSSLAFDLGYASLGPFNRAFKDATGQTPSQWRLESLRALGDGSRAGSPIAKDSG